MQTSRLFLAVIRLSFTCELVDLKSWFVSFPSHQRLTGRFSVGGNSHRELTLK